MKLSIPMVKSFFRKYAATIVACLVAREFAKSERAKVDAYIEPILAKFNFRYDYDERLPNFGEPITKAKDLYLSKANHDAFYAACDEAHKAHGYNLEPGYCPALVAEHAVIECERAVLKAAAAHFEEPGFDKLYNMDLRAKALDLFLHPPTA